MRATELLQHIHPAHLSYDEWLPVGMALMEEVAPTGEDEVHQDISTEQAFADFCATVGRRPSDDSMRKTAMAQARVRLRQEALLFHQAGFRVPDELMERLMDTATATVIAVFQTAHWQRGISDPEAQQVAQVMQAAIDDNFLSAMAAFQAGVATAKAQTK